MTSPYAQAGYSDDVILFTSWFFFHSVSSVQHSGEWEYPRRPIRGKAQIRTWQEPPADWVQINTDGAYVPEVGKGGWGAVGRDNDEILVFAAGQAGELEICRSISHRPQGYFQRSVKLVINYFSFSPWLFVLVDASLEEATPLQDASTKALNGDGPSSTVKLEDKMEIHC
jgi:hypothetical protein